MRRNSSKRVLGRDENIAGFIVVLIVKSIKYGPHQSRVPPLYREK